MSKPFIPARPGDDWAITAHTTTDGDTVRATLHGFRPVESSYSVGGLVIQRVDLIGTDPAVWPHGRSLRLLTYNTPEEGKQLPAPLPDGRKGTWAEGRSDLAEWLDQWGPEGLRCETWEDSVERDFGRLLADVYVAGRRDLTVSQYMLRLGWPPYLGTRS